MLQLQRTIGNAASVKMIGQLLVQRTPWDDNWGTEIDSLNAGKNALDKTNNNYMAAKAKCTGKLDLDAWATRFQASLRAQDQLASAALTILKEVTGLRHPTNTRAPLGLPTGWENELYEFVNVKRLYESGDTTLTPGGTAWTKNNKGQDSEMKPDYMVAGDTGPSGTVGGSLTKGGDKTVGRVGDHAREKKSRTADEAKDHVADETKGKLTTYPDMRVSVVVDISDSPAAVADLCNGLVTTDFVPALKSKIVDTTILGRLDRLTVVIKDRLVVVNQTDLA